MLAYHLGAAVFLRNSSHPYRAFMTNFNSLRMRASLVCSTRELDKYLWLTGLYREWKRFPEKPRINVDVERLFAKASGEIKRDLALMMGESSTGPI